MTLRHGIDLISLRAFRVLLEDEGSDFKARCFTPAELALAESLNDKVAFFAGRFAAKEAVAKALGTGFTSTISPLDIEILNEASGQPRIKLREKAEAAANELGIREWRLSISHSVDAAIASAIAIQS